MRAQVGMYSKLKVQPLGPGLICFPVPDGTVQYSSSMSPAVPNEKMPPLRLKKKKKEKTALVMCDWRRQWHPTPVLLPGESHGRRSLVGVAQSRTRLKRLSSSSRLM